MNTNEYLLGALRAEGLSHVLMVPAGLIDGFYPALANPPGLTPIVATHEAGAARGPYLLDVRCDKAFTTPATPFDKAKKEWHDDV